MTELALYLVIAIASVLVSSFSQMMLKLSAEKKYPSKIREYINPLVISAYVLFFGSTLVMVAAYRVLPLSLGPIVEALGYVFIALIGFIVLREKVTRKKVLGMLLIIAGVLISSFS